MGRAGALFGDGALGRGKRTRSDAPAGDIGYAAGLIIGDRGSLVLQREHSPFLLLGFAHFLHLEIRPAPSQVASCHVAKEAPQGFDVVTSTPVLPVQPVDASAQVFQLATLFQHGGLQGPDQSFLLHSVVLLMPAAARLAPRNKRDPGAPVDVIGQSTRRLQEQIDLRLRIGPWLGLEGGLSTHAPFPQALHVGHFDGLSVRVLLEIRGTRSNNPREALVPS